MDIDKPHTHAQYSTVNLLQAKNIHKNSIKEYLYKLMLHQ